MIVDLLGNGDFTSISEAINNALPDTEIIIRPGLYRETIIIDKPLKLISEGEGEIIVESPTDYCLSMETDYTIVRGLTLRKLLDSEQCSTVNVFQEKLVLEDCDITSIFIDGSETNLVIRRCKIHDSISVGILIANNAQATIEDCEIYGNLGTGIYIIEKSNPTIRACKIYENQQNGILITEKSLGLIEYCNIYRNNFSGIGMIQGSNPTIRSCQIYNNSSYGLLFDQSGKGRVEYSQIKGNTLAGLWNKNRGDVDIISCKIYLNKPPYFWIFLTLFSSFSLRIKFFDLYSLGFTFVLFTTIFNIFWTFLAFEKRGIKKRFTIPNLLLTIELGTVGGIMFVNGFNPSLLGILLASGTIWITMLVYRFFK